MAKYTEYGRKVVDGVEVYEVGKLQLWSWTGWTSRGYDSATPGVDYLTCNADSLAKGKYVVVECKYCFGFISRYSFIVASYGSLKAAIGAVKDYEAYDHTHQERSYTGKVICHYYEVWHIMDDDDLWQLWEHDAAQSLQYDTDYHVYDGQRCVLDLQSQPYRLYAITSTTDCGDIVSCDYYDNLEDYADALLLALDVHDCSLDNLMLKSADEIGVYVTDDYDHYIDAPDVHVAYVTVSEP